MSKSRQQTLFHHFASGPKTKSPSTENGNVTPQQTRGQNITDQDDVSENFDDDLLLAVCQDWEETTLTHPTNEGGAVGDPETRGAPQSVHEMTGLPARPAPGNPPVPAATQLEDLPGFDASAGEIWIYPTNLPVRDYQFNIVQQALFRNTMVSLPTGLGKTFVAAVVMYNFYRWYPEGRVVFMAPTKPLVAQQIEACHNVMGIQQSDMAEMTGNMPPAERKKAWHKCRVFFLTPQVLMNDLSRMACPTQLVKCVVVDEAHKALGNHAYCQVVRELSKYSSEFRVLALSATPGSDLKAIQQVLTNLLISHIEIRSEDSIDIQRYVHERKVEKVVVPLDEELKSVRDQYLRILSVYVGRLTRCEVLYNKDPASLTKFQILQSRDAFRQNPPPQVKSRGAVEGDFALCISLYHGYELLLQHGLRSLHSFLRSTVDSDRGFSRTRQELLRNPGFVQLMDALGDKFGGREESDGSANRSGLFSAPGTPQVKEVKPYVTSHPKMAKLQEIVLEHFRQSSASEESPSLNRPVTSKQRPPTGVLQSTRVMIFAQYRDSVHEIAEMLNTHRPLLRCMGFVGQASAGKHSKGISQKEQLRVVREFREGGYNTLVCTCVGEEGLDIGDVDLIVCYDAHKSPIRLMQRMGRTGRKRQGRIVMLVTEGKEAAVYDRSQYSKKGIVKALQGNARSLQLYPNNPRMVPRGLNPAPHKMFITVAAFTSKEAKRKSNTAASGETGLEAFLNKGKSAKKSTEFLSPEELAYWSANYKLDAAERGCLPSIPDRGRFVTLGDKDKQSSRGRKNSHLEVSLSEWSPWQMSKQPVRFVEHSRRCHQFVELMEFIDLQNLTDGDDIYGLEMQTYLDQEDIVRPRNRGIMNYCTKLTRDPPSNGEHLKTASRSRHPEPTVLDGKEETTVRSVGKEQGREGSKRRRQPIELMSSPSESSHTDDNLPDVLQDDSANLAVPEIPGVCHVPTSASDKGTLSGTKCQKEKATESKSCHLQDDSGSRVRPEVPACGDTPPSTEKNGLRLNSRSKGKADVSKSCKPDKPRKHKQKRRHLRPVLDSSDGDDDFTSNIKQEAPWHNSPNQKGADDVDYDTPEPMDTDSDNFLILKRPQKVSEPVPCYDVSSSQLNNTEDDLSFLFPTQSIFSRRSSFQTDDSKPTKFKIGNGKLAIPPAPPSLASLDLLDDLDTTFNLTQHFQSESHHFGGSREPPNRPSTTACFGDSFKVGEASSLKKPQEARPNELKSKVPFGALKDVSGMVSHEQSKTLTKQSSHDGDEGIEVENTGDDDLKRKRLKAFGEIEPQFDLNMDFTLMSSDEEHETTEQHNTNKDKTSSTEKPFNQDDDIEEIDLERVGIDNLEGTGVIGTPQAFDVETPMLESAFTETSVTSTDIAADPPVENLLPALKVAVKKMSCSISTAQSRKHLLKKVSKRPSPATPETPKCGLQARTKTSFAGRLCSDGTNGLSSARNEKPDSSREVDLEIKDALEIGCCAVRVNRSLDLREEEPANTEKLRKEVLGLAEAKFDLGFDLDSLDEDVCGEEDGVIAPSPNVERHQEYINLSQVAIPRRQVGPSASGGPESFQSRNSSTPVPKADSAKLISGLYTDFLSPIALDMKRVPDLSPGFDAQSRNSRVNEPESSQTTSTKDDLGKPARTQRQLRNRLSLARKSPEKYPTIKHGDGVSPATNSFQSDATGDALPRPLRGAGAASLGHSSDARKSALGKRKSAPVTNLADDSPIGVKRRVSEPANAPPTHVQSTGVFGLTEGRAWQDDHGEIGATKDQVLVLDDDEEEEKQDQCKNSSDPIGPPPVDSDENDEASQPVQPRKRRKAVALRSPTTPAAKTPIRPTSGGSSTKAASKPLVFSSDDDLQSPLIRRPRKRRQIIMTPDREEADEDFTGDVARRTHSVAKKGPAGKDRKGSRNKKKTKRGWSTPGQARGFLEEEVVVSDGGEYSSDEEGSDLDNSLEGFINNASQLTQASQSALRADDMHAVYMQSVRSPRGAILHPNRNRFKMVQQPDPDDVEIFSQAPVQDDSYCESSFVVREGQGDGAGIRRGTGDRLEESFFENTINPDNILSARRRRRRNLGPSRAEQILREGRRKVLMSSSTTSTSDDEGNEKPRSLDKRKACQKNPDSSGWLSTDKSNKPKNSSLAIRRREPVNCPQVSPVKGNQVFHSARDSVSTYPKDVTDKSDVFKQHSQLDGLFPNHSQGSAIRHFLSGIAQQSNTGTNALPNPKPVSRTSRPTSSLGKTAEGASDGLTLAEKERAQRLRRQEEKKREFKAKMEEKNREQQQQQQQQHKLSQEQVQSRQQKEQLRPDVRRFPEQPQLQRVGVKKQPHQLDAHRQPASQQWHQQQKQGEARISAGELSDGARPGSGKAGVMKTYQQTKGSSLEQQHHVQQQQQLNQPLEQRQQQQPQQPVHQQLKAEVCVGRSSHSAAPSTSKAQVKKIHPQAKSSPSELLTPVNSNARVTGAAVSEPTHNPRDNASSGVKAPTVQGSTSPPVAPTSLRLISNTTLTGCQDALNRGKPTVLIDSKELLSSSHIVSTLALQHGLNPVVCQLTGCDYIVSARMGVEKKSMSDFGNGANKNKLIDRVRHLCELFDRPCLILEKDRVKPGDEKKPKHIIRTTYFDRTLAALSKTHIKVLYSDSLDDTARILADLVRIEKRKGEGLAPPAPMNPTREQVLKFYQSLPRVSHATALSLMRAFPCVQQLIDSTPELLKKAANISQQRSAEIFCFLQHRFDQQMIGLSSGS